MSLASPGHAKRRVSTAHRLSLASPGFFFPSGAGEGFFCAGMFFFMASGGMFVLLLCFFLFFVFPGGARECVSLGAEPLFFGVNHCFLALRIELLFLLLFHRTRIHSSH